MDESHTPYLSPDYRSTVLRATLIAESDGARAYRFDVHLRGERETVFLDF